MWKFADLSCAKGQWNNFYVTHIVDCSIPHVCTLYIYEEFHLIDSHFFLARYLFYRWHDIPSRRQSPIGQLIPVNAIGIDNGKGILFEQSKGSSNGKVCIHKTDMMNFSFPGHHIKFSSKNHKKKWANAFNSNSRKYSIFEFLVVCLPHHFVGSF